MFPLNPPSQQTTRDREVYKINFARTEAYRRSAVPSIQRMLNCNAREQEFRRTRDQGNLQAGGAREAGTGGGINL